MNSTGNGGDLWTDFLLVLLAVFGGVARYLDEYLKTDILPKFGKAMAAAFVSGFSGYMVGLIANKVAPEWALVAGGLGGYLGTRGLDMANDLLRSRLGAPRQRHGHDDDNNP